MGLIGSSLDQAAAHGHAANCRGVRDDVLARKTVLLSLLMSNFAQALNADAIML
jgi:hypothetical protein